MNKTPKAATLETLKAQAVSLADLELAKVKNGNPDTVGEPSLEPELIDAKILAHLLSVSVASIYRDIEEGRLPKPIKLGGRVRWRLKRIREFLDELERDQNGTAD